MLQYLYMVIIVDTKLYIQEKTTQIQTSDLQTVVSYMMYAYISLLLQLHIVMYMQPNSIIVIHPVLLSMQLLVLRSVNKNDYRHHKSLFSLPNSQVLKDYHAFMQPENPNAHNYHDIKHGQYSEQ